MLLRSTSHVFKIDIDTAAWGPKCSNSFACATKYLEEDYMTAIFRPIRRATASAARQLQSKTKHVVVLSKDHDDQGMVVE